MRTGIHGMKKGRRLDQEMHRNTGITPPELVNPTVVIQHTIFNIPNRSLKKVEVTSNRLF